jgi:AcrR family transcriptional regulator
MVDDVNPRRPYNSAGRAEQARIRRQRVLSAALSSMSTLGYAATTMPLIARQAQVSVEFVYKTFSDKPTLARELLDFVNGGDDQPIPVAARPAVQEMIAEPDARKVLRLYAEMAGAINDRGGRLLLALAAAAPTDPRLAQIWQTAQQQRLGGARAVVADVAGKATLRVPVEAAQDRVWALVGPELHALLRSERGWAGEDYVSWLADCLCDSLLAGHAAHRPPPRR